MQSNYNYADMRGTSLDSLDDCETYDHYLSELMLRKESKSAKKQGTTIEAILFADNGFNSFFD